LKYIGPEVDIKECSGNACKELTETLKMKTNEGHVDKTTCHPN
jgi:hypothetical protein